MKKKYIFYGIVLIVFLLVCGCIGSGNHKVTLHFKDRNGNPIDGAQVETVKNTGLTDKEGNVVFNLEGNFPYDIKVYNQETTYTFYQVYPTGNYYEYTLEGSPRAICIIDPLSLKADHDNKGIWTSVHIDVKNTGSSGNCTLILDLYEGDTFKDNTLTLVETIKQSVYVESGGIYQPFEIKIKEPRDSISSFKIYVGV